jgi:hypothetical protein
LPHDGKSCGCAAAATEARKDRPMKLHRALAVLAVCALPPGCASDFDVGRPHTFFRYGIRNIVLAFVDSDHENLRVRRNRRLAQEAWEEVCQREGDAFSPDFAQGYRDGFIDYLNFGGKGDVPPRPPHYYWSPQYETPPGRQAVEDWYAGFRRGAGDAIASGMRETIILPLGRPPLQTTDPGRTLRSGTPSQQPPQPDAVLPMPREVDPRQP